MVSRKCLLSSDINKGMQQLSIINLLCTHFGSTIILPMKNSTNFSTWFSTLYYRENLHVLLITKSNLKEFLNWLSIGQYLNCIFTWFALSVCHTLKLFKKWSRFNLALKIILSFQASRGARAFNVQ